MEIYFLLFYKYIHSNLNCVSRPRKPKIFTIWTFAHSVLTPDLQIHTDVSPAPSASPCSSCPNLKAFAGASSTRPAWSPAPYGHNLSQQGWEGAGLLLEPRDAALEGMRGQRPISLPDSDHIPGLSRLIAPHSFHERPTGEEGMVYLKDSGPNNKTKECPDPCPKDSFAKSHTDV